MNDRVRQRRDAKRRSMLVRRAIIAGVALASVGGIAALAIVTRGSDVDDGPVLGEAAQHGRDVALQRSCVGCHGRAGEGGANGSGPAWVGLFGSTVTLDDGTTVVADRDYLAESIRDPRAKQVAGFAKMPIDTISEADIAAIVDYIVELTPTTVP